MKIGKKSDPGMIILILFLISSGILLFVNFFNLLPDFARMVLVYVWLAEFTVLVAWVCLFHNLRQYISKR
jgi:hypothetical protein